MPQIPSDLSYLIEFLDMMVVPLTMVWLIFCWFGMLDDPAKEKDEDKKKTKQERCRATTKGFGAGMVLAILLLFGLYGFVFKDGVTALGNVLQIAPLEAGLAVAAGILIGIVMRYLKGLAAEGSFAMPPSVWGCIVTAGTALALASLAIYYADSSLSSPHAWLVWGYVSLLFSYRVAFLIGD